ncbi:hypothetical protein [Actinomadura chokoriensis]|uniref:Uncharacterized protein n=1 Tax=Actinomadura chokoriensis TaxID=454156 RepID=A0ABV4RDA8_9ACTN
MPEPLTPPPRPPVRPHHCGARAAGSVPARNCNAPARLYACGWRCDEHKPVLLHEQEN